MNSIEKREAVPQGSESGVKGTGWTEAAAAVIRGLTCRGSCGGFVHAFNGETKAAAGPVLRIPVEFPESMPLKLDEAMKVLQPAAEALRAYIAREKSYPAAVELAAGMCFGLGATYEEAAAASGCSLQPDVPAAASRSDVVRGKIALVTGGAQGFGEGIVRTLVSDGAWVFIADLNYDGASRLADELSARCGRVAARALPVDVTDDASAAELFAAAVRETGGIDLLVSNAGVLKAGSVKEMAIRDFNFVTAVDYTGFFLCAKYGSRLMALQNSTAASHYLTDIIAVSSKSGLEGSNKNGAYSGAKFGTIGLTQSFALELIEDRIKVNALCPGNFLDGPLWSDPERGLFVQYLRAGKVPGARNIEDVRRFYESKVPMNRGCTTADVMKALYYIVEQQYETGQAVPVTGGQVMLN